MSAHRADQPQFEIINASVPGYTSYQELVFFKRYLLNGEPDVVIWSYCLNDNHKFLSQFDEKGRMLLTPEAEETLTIHNKWEFLVSHSYLLSSLWFRIVALRQQYRNQNRSEFVWEKLADFNVAWKEVYWSSYEKYVSEMLHLLNERNAKLAIVVFPFEPQLNYRHDAANYDYAVKPQRILYGICEKYHVPSLDLYPTFSTAYDEGQKLYRDGIHLNNAGHRLTASTIERFLTANILLPEVPR
jgi:lysophospholipase L1-like esterase